MPYVCGHCFPPPRRRADASFVCELCVTAAVCHRLCRRAVPQPHTRIHTHTQAHTHAPLPIFSFFLFPACRRFVHLCCHVTSVPVEDPTKGCRVYVGNLAWSVTDEELEAHMSAAGSVSAAEVMRYNDGRSKVRPCFSSLSLSLSFCLSVCVSLSASKIVCPLRRSRSLCASASVSVPASTSASLAMSALIRAAPL